MKISTQEVTRLLRMRNLETTKNHGANGNGKSSNPGNGASPAATVEVSSTAQEANRVKKAVEEAPDIRENIVSALKARVDAGNYNVPSSDIAELMMRRAYADRIQ